MLLHGTFRSLPRPSSPLSSIGIRHKPILAWPYYCPFFLYTFRLKKKFCIFSFLLHWYVSNIPASSFPSLVMSNICSLSSLKEPSYWADFSIGMGLIRVELMTPSLSEKCSNRLSYRPYKKRVSGKNEKEVSICLVYFKTNIRCILFRRLNNLQITLSLRKEVIQPHLPVRLPCYDFTLLTKRTFGTVLPYGLD